MGEAVKVDGEEDVGNIYCCCEGRRNVLEPRPIKLPFPVLLLDDGEARLGDAAGEFPNNM